MNCETGVCGGMCFDTFARLHGVEITPVCALRSADAALQTVNNAV